MGSNAEVNSFTELQEATARWRDYNFPNHTADDQLMGMVEELGELAHARLKTKQGIRGDEDLPQLETDAIGDIIIYLCGYCTRRNISLAACISMAWWEVKDRDWIKYPTTGRPSEPTASPHSSNRPFGDPWENPDDGPSGARFDERSLD